LVLSQELSFVVCQWRFLACSAKWREYIFGAILLDISYSKLINNNQTYFDIATKNTAMHTFTQGRKIAKVLYVKRTILCKN
jgi:hypothetical protein